MQVNRSSTMPAPKHNGLPPTIWRLQTDHWRLEGRWAASDEIAGGSRGPDRVLVVRAWPISEAARLALTQRNVAFLVQACRQGDLGALVDRWQLVALEGAARLCGEGQGEGGGQGQSAKRRRS